MRQIPGKLYDLENITLITPEEGKRWHYIQALAGDQTDGYSGVPGIGVKRAAALFEESGYTWDTIVKAFAEKDLGEDVALMNARLAKILTCNDYDLAEQRPIFWTPTDAGDGDDDGAGVQLSEDS
jgi:DNA polymerase-1